MTCPPHWAAHKLHTEISHSCHHVPGCAGAVFLGHWHVVLEATEVLESWV